MTNEELLNLKVGDEVKVFSSNWAGERAGKIVHGLRFEVAEKPSQFVFDPRVGCEVPYVRCWPRLIVLVEQWTQTNTWYFAFNPIDIEIAEP